MKETYLRTLEAERDELERELETLLEADRISNMTDNFYYISGRARRRADRIAEVRARIRAISETLSGVSSSRT